MLLGIPVHQYFQNAKPDDPTFLKGAQELFVVWHRSMHYQDQYGFQSSGHQNQDQYFFEQSTEVTFCCRKYGKGHISTTFPETGVSFQLANATLVHCETQCYHNLKNRDESFPLVLHQPFVSAQYLHTTIQDRD